MPSCQNLEWLPAHNNALISNLLTRKTRARGHQHTFRHAEMQEPPAGGTVIVEGNYFYLARGNETCNLRILAVVLNN